MLLYKTWNLFQKIGLISLKFSKFEVCFRKKSGNLRSTFAKILEILGPFPKNLEFCGLFHIKKNLKFEDSFYINSGSLKNPNTGCFFLSDNFETLIIPSVLKIFRFCKVVMINKTGPFYS